MPTTVHIPDALLERAQARAKALGISRNRLIIEALEAHLAAQDTWPPELERALKAPIGKELSTAIDDLEQVIQHNRRNRTSPPDL
jgi:predicted transcriptional regulator